jgi:hypothetical protein
MHGATTERVVLAPAIGIFGASATFLLVGNVRRRTLQRKALRRLSLVGGMCAMRSLFL